MAELGARRTARKIVAAMALVWMMGFAACGGQALDESERPSVEDSEQPTAAVEVQVHRDVSTPCSPNVGPVGPWQFARSVAWSPDGSRVYFGRDDSIFAAAADGSRVWKLVDPVPRGHEPNSPSRPIVGTMTAFSPSPDGRSLAYSTCEYPDKGAEARSKPPTSGEDYQYEIALAAITDRSLRRLTTADSYDNFPVWSPDGTRIAFLSGRHVKNQFLQHRASQLVHVYTMEADGTGVRDLTPDRPGKHLAVVNHAPQWSPDGQWLAFTASDQNLEHALYAVRTDGTNLRRLAAAVLSPVSWSPDGQRLAFAQAEDATVVLVTVAADGSDAERVATIDGWQPPYGDPDPTQAWIETLAWSPAGDQILFTCGQSICVSATDGTPVGESAPSPEGSAVAAWSPDGTRIAVTTRGESPSGAVLYSMAPNGSQVRVLVQAGLGLVAARARNLGPIHDRRACADGYVVPDPAANAGLVNDCQVLLALRDELFGKHTPDWNPGTPIDQWVGVTVAGRPLRVTELRLSSQSRYGYRRQFRYEWPDLGSPVPAALGELTELRALDLSSNWHRGSIPTELGQLVNLRELYLAGNAFTGCIPSAVADLDLQETDLRHLELPVCQAAA